MIIVIHVRSHAHQQLGLFISSTDAGRGKITIDKMSGLSILLLLKTEINGRIDCSEFMTRIPARLQSMLHCHLYFEISIENSIVYPIR